MISSLKQSFTRLPLFWRLQIVIWTGYFIHGCFSRIGYYDHVRMGIGMSLLLEPTEFILSSALRQIYRRLNLNGIFNLRVIGTILLMCSGAVVLQLIVAKFGAPWVAHWAGYHARPSTLLTRITYFMLIYVGWSVAYVWLKTVFATQEARAAAQRAELQMLRLQLNPHFLFNSLNNIANQIHTQPDTAEEMTHDLSDFLRVSIDQDLGLIVPLTRELEIMTGYLKIEKLRFGDRLHYEIQVAPAARSVQIPSFILQPIAENAVKHGFNTAAPPWTLRIDITHTADTLHLRITNNGTLQTDWDSKPENGIGIANLRRRLALHYPGRHHFTLRQDGPLVAAEISLEGPPCSV